MPANSDTSVVALGISSVHSNAIHENRGSYKDTVSRDRHPSDKKIQMHSPDQDRPIRLKLV